MNDKLIIHKDNPFKGDIQKFIERNSKSNNITKTYTDAGQLSSEEITVIYRRNYATPSFTKLFKNKELLMGLSPWACKVLIHIALHLSYNAQRINITAKKLNLDVRRYSITMIELMERRIIVKQKPGWYWVNITLLIVGNIQSNEANNSTQQGIDTDDGREC